MLQGSLCYSGLLKGPEHAAGVIKSRRCRGDCIFRDGERDERVSNSRYKSVVQNSKMRSSSR